MHRNSALWRRPSAVLQCVGRQFVDREAQHLSRLDWQIDVWTCQFQGRASFGHERLELFEYKVMKRRGGPALSGERRVRCRKRLHSRFELRKKFSYRN